MSQVGFLTAQGHDKVSICVDGEYGSDCRRDFLAVHEDEFTVHGPVEVAVGVRLQGRSLTVLTLGSMVEGHGFSTHERDGVTGFVGQLLDVLHIAAFLPLFDGLLQAGDLSVERADVVLDLLDLRLEILDIVLESAVVVLLGAAGEDEAHRAG